MGRLKELRAYVDKELMKMENESKRNSAFVHLYGVSLAAGILAEKRNEDSELACMAAMLHDIAAYKTGSYEDHAHKGADMAREILESLALTTPEENDVICSAIYHHDDKLVVDGPMDELLKDADVVHHTMNDPSKAIKEKEQARYDMLREEFGLEPKGNAPQEFRGMRRKKQVLSKEVCGEILKQEWRACLSFHGENGYPYGIPINFYYDEEENAVYFHGAGTGHKIDSLKKNPKVCLTTWNRGVQKEGDWSYYVDSVIIRGRIEIIKDPDKALKMAEKLGRKYFPTEDEVQEEIRKDMARVTMLCLHIDHISGKHVHER